MKSIVMTTGDVTLVDDEDYEMLSKFTWSDNGRGYVVTCNPTRCMHRMVMLPEPGLTVDHINHDTLDNRRSNLRVCTQTMNNANSRAQSNNTSGYKGVDWYKRNRKWRAEICVGGHRKYIGLFSDKEDAARAYDEAAVELFGEYASLNFPK